MRSASPLLNGLRAYPGLVKPGETVERCLAGAVGGVRRRGSHWWPPAKWAIALMILIPFLLQWGYFALFEAFWNGQTPGKRLLRLRVIQESGRPVGLFESMGRNLLRSAAPALYCLGVHSQGSVAGEGLVPKRLKSFLRATRTTLTCSARMQTVRLGLLLQCSEGNGIAQFRDWRDGVLPLRSRGPC